MRKLLYLLIAAVFMFAVGIKVNVIKGKSRKVIVSKAEEWRKHGKPVSVESAGRGKVVTNTRVTGEVKGDVISASVPYSVKKMIAPGQKFTVRKNGETVSGSVSYVSDHIDTLSGLYTLRLKCSGAPRIKFGKFVVADIETGTYENVLRIPLPALVQEGGKYFAWVTGSDNRVRKQEIVPGVRNGNFAQVLRGLKAGDIVCVSGVEYLLENDLVRVYKGIQL